MFNNDLRLFFIEDTLNNMLKYLKFIENSIELELNRVDSEFTHIKSSLSTKEAELLYDFKYENKIWYLNEMIPKITYSNFIIYCFSFLEHNLNELCKDLQKELSHKLSHKDLREGTYAYLTKVIGMEINEKRWSELSKIRDMRNDLVHKGGGSFFIEKHDKRKENYLKYLEQHKLISLFVSNNYIFCPHLDYCFYLIEYIRLLFNELYDSKKSLLSKRLE